MECLGCLSQSSGQFAITWAWAISMCGCGCSCSAILTCVSGPVRSSLCKCSFLDLLHRSEIFRTSIRCIRSSKISWHCNCSAGRAAAVHRSFNFGIQTLIEIWNWNKLNKLNKLRRRRRRMNVVCVCCVLFAKPKKWNDDWWWWWWWWWWDDGVWDDDGMKVYGMMMEWRWDDDGMRMMVEWWWNEWWWNDHDDHGFCFFVRTEGPRCPWKAGQKLQMLPSAQCRVDSNLL